MSFKDVVVELEMSEDRPAGLPAVQQQGLLEEQLRAPSRSVRVGLVLLRVCQIAALVYTLSTAVLEMRWLTTTYAVPNNAPVGRIMVVLSIVIALALTNLALDLVWALFVVRPRCRLAAARCCGADARGSCCCRWGGTPLGWGASDLAADCIMAGLWFAILLSLMLQQRWWPIPLACSSINTGLHLVSLVLGTKLWVARNSAGVAQLQMTGDQQAQPPRRPSKVYKVPDLV